MTLPEEAVGRARAAAAAIRAEGAYAPAPQPAEPPPLTLEKLAAWALIEPDLRNVRSTRRLGAPITAIKQGLLRLLEQYHAELRSQQMRFNISVLAELGGLEVRLSELERRLDEQRPPR